MLLIIQEFDLVSQDRHLDPKKTIQFNFEKKKFSLWTIKYEAPLTTTLVYNIKKFTPKKGLAIRY
jgi:hypothetical protein